MRTIFWGALAVLAFYLCTPRAEAEARIPTVEDARYIQYHLHNMTSGTELLTRNDLTALSFVARFEGNRNAVDRFVVVANQYLKKLEAQKIALEMHLEHDFAPVQLEPTEVNFLILKEILTYLKSNPSRDVERGLVWFQSRMESLINGPVGQKETPQSRWWNTHISNIRGVYEEVKRIRSYRSLKTLDDYRPKETSVLVGAKDLTLISLQGALQLIFAGIRTPQEATRLFNLTTLVVDRLENIRRNDQYILLHQEDMRLLQKLMEGLAKYGEPPEEWGSVAREGYWHVVHWLAQSDSPSAEMTRTRFVGWLDTPEILRNYSRYEPLRQRLQRDASIKARQDGIQLEDTAAMAAYRASELSCADVLMRRRSAKVK